MALVKVELDGDETVEGLAKPKSEVIFLAIVVDTQLLMMNPPGVTLIQAAAVMAREDHLRLLLEYG